MEVEVRVPTLGESVVDATVSTWLKQEGDRVKAGEMIAELETDKVNIEVPSEQEGTLLRIMKPAGETVGIGDVIAVVQTGNVQGATVAQSAPVAVMEQVPAAAPSPEPVAPAAQATAKTPEQSERQTVSPVAQRIAAQHAVDLHTVSGSGPGGRITKEDVARQVGSAAPGAVAAQNGPNVPGASGPSPAATPQAAPMLGTQTRSEERIAMSRRRQTIARRLVEAQQTAAMLTTFNEVDMSAVIDLRKRRKESFRERTGANLGFMSFFAKAVLGALKAFPWLNAEIQSNEIVVKHYYDLGIAVGAAEGLVVPVIRDADRKSFAEIEREVTELAGHAKQGSLTIQQLMGGTFTITNGGVYGSLMSTPILNAPQVGILGMHKIQERPIALNGAVVVRPMMYLALSYDHRIVDGSDAVRFLVRIKELIEDPEVLLLEG
ncbi:MAG: 2-oxoglutarate dehydrogenase complex dihydrolipoyllysine-residue succinyltransferase [Herpetosiphon sp.]